MVLSGSDGWGRVNRFALEWRNPAADHAAPIDGVEYRLCPLANSHDDESGCVRGSRTAPDLSRIDDLAMPAAGAWRVLVALRDAAGNVDWDRGAEVSALRFDATAPMASFLPFDPADPATVRVAASDDSSGVAKVEIEARRRGDANWQALAVTPGGGRFSAPLDDDVLTAGTYDLRARATDQAGNERTTTTLEGSVPLVVKLPIRAVTELAVGHPERVRVKSSKGKKPTYKRVLVAKPQADHGKVVSIEGKLTDEAGNPRPGAAIRVLERVDLPGRAFQELAVVRTNVSGVFRFRALPGPARQLRFVYPGTATTRPRTEDVELQVRAGITLSPSRRKVRNGDEVTFRGNLLGGPVPEAGKLLTLQAGQIAVGAHSRHLALVPVMVDSASRIALRTPRRRRATGSASWFPKRPAIPTLVARRARQCSSARYLGNVPHTSPTRSRTPTSAPRSRCSSRLAARATPRSRFRATAWGRGNCVPGRWDRQNFATGPVGTREIYPLVHEPRSPARRARRENEGLRDQRERARASGGPVRGLPGQDRGNRVPPEHRAGTLRRCAPRWTSAGGNVPVGLRRPGAAARNRGLPRVVRFSVGRGLRLFGDICEGARDRPVRESNHGRLTRNWRPRADLHRHNTAGQRVPPDRFVPLAAEAALPALRCALEGRLHRSQGAAVRWE